MEEPAEGQEVEVTVGESRTEMLARHQREIKELQYKEIGLKKAAAKGSKAEQKAKKKQAEEEVARLDVKMKARHAKELAALGFRADEVTDGNGLEGLVKAIAGISSGGKAAAQAGRPSKGQKWRDRRAHQDAERAQRIQEEQNNVVSQRKVEEEELDRKLRPLGFSLKEIKSDGHCLYRAVEDQLALHPDVMPRHSYLGLRGLAAAYMRAHPDDFVPFIENSEVDGETVEERLEKYCSDVETTAVWGGQLELGALAHSLRKHIVVYSATLPDVEMGQEYGAEEPGHPVTPSIRLSYHRHAFGLGEHFNSVVPLPLPVPL